jgi:predicted DNA-binding transcriptional regulator YafY
MRLWRLDRIDSVDLLDRNFDRLEEFSLTKYAAQSFGVFQEEPQEVLLRFAPEAAADAATWIFHPSQSMEYDSDGALLLRFCAGGKQEILSHLLSWNTSVSVISPASLQREISNLASRLNDHHNNS